MAGGCKHFDAHGGPENKPVSRFSFDSKVSTLAFCSKTFTCFVLDSLFVLENTLLNMWDTIYEKQYLK